MSSRTHAEIPVLLVAGERINNVYRDYDRARALRPVAHGPRLLVIRGLRQAAFAAAGAPTEANIFS